jgi:hypothetical protein
MQGGYVVLTVAAVPFLLPFLLLCATWSGWAKTTREDTVPTHRRKRILTCLVAEHARCIPNGGTPAAT